jgi:hypothetical protein
MYSLAIALALNHPSILIFAPELRDAMPLALRMSDSRLFEIAKVPFLASACICQQPFHGVQRANGAMFEC